MENTNEQQGRRKPDNQTLTNPAKFFISWKSKEESSIYGNKISYIRQKTGKRINFPITDNITLILEYFKPVGAIDATSFIFPILNQDIHKSPSQIKDRINKVNKRVNKDLKEFAVICDININLHFYIARHTMASTLKKAGQSITAIKEIMGHEDERTFHMPRSLNRSASISFTPFFPKVWLIKT